MSYLISDDRHGDRFKLRSFHSGQDVDSGLWMVMPYILVITSILKMKAECSYETLLTTYKSV